MKPTVGRIVHFYTSNRENAGKTLVHDGPYAAIITGIGGDGVWLYIFPEGRTVGLLVADSVPWAANGTDASTLPGREFWTWPPREG